MWNASCVPCADAKHAGSGGGGTERPRLQVPEGLGHRAPTVCLGLGTSVQGIPEARELLSTYPDSLESGIGVPSPGGSGVVQDGGPRDDALHCQLQPCLFVDRLCLTSKPHTDAIKENRIVNVCLASTQLSDVLSGGSEKIRDHI